MGRGCQSASIVMGIQFLGFSMWLDKFCDYITLSTDFKIFSLFVWYQYYHCDSHNWTGTEPNPVLNIRLYYIAMPLDVDCYASKTASCVKSISAIQHELLHWTFTVCRKRSTSTTAKIHRFVTFVMYHFIITVPAAIYWAHIDDTNQTKQWFLAVLDVQVHRHL